jgi:hypothetical protein
MGVYNVRELALHTKFKSEDPKVRDLSGDVRVGIVTLIKCILM